jgi:hypothetical protein
MIRGKNRARARNPQVRPQCQFQASRHGGSLDGGNNRLGQAHARRPHGRIAVRRDLRECAGCDGFKIRSGEHRDIESGICIEGSEGIDQGPGYGSVNGIATLGSQQTDDGDSIDGGYRNGHGETFLGRTLTSAAHYREHASYGSGEAGKACALDSEGD